MWRGLFRIQRSPFKYNSLDILYCYSFLYFMENDVNCWWIRSFLWPLFCLGRLNYKFGKICTSTANKFTEIIQESFLAAKVILGFGNSLRSVRECVRTYDEHRKAVVKSQLIVFATSKVLEPCG